MGSVENHLVERLPERERRRFLAACEPCALVAAACLQFRLIAPRLAKALLTTHDCAQSDSFHVTHEFPADMLGVRRVGITVAAGSLHRSGLEAAACACYANDRRTYRSLLA